MHVQWFDEYDYDQKRFINDGKFWDEEQADKVCVIVNDLWNLVKAGHLSRLLFNETVKYFKE